MSDDVSVEQVMTARWTNPQSALRDAGAHLRLWIPAAITLAVDLFSKSWAFENLQAGEVRSAIPGCLVFQLSLNPGALFGLGAGMVGLFIFASVAALAFVVYFFAGSNKHQRTLHVALGLVLAGALGNLYDRTFTRHDLVSFRSQEGGPTIQLVGSAETSPGGDGVTFRPWYAPDAPQVLVASQLTEPVRRVGAVRDFVKITTSVGEHELWPWVFNVADALLVIGVIMLLLGCWMEGRRLQRATAEAEADAASVRT